MAAYLAISLFYFAKSAPWTQWYLGTGQDPAQFIWFIAWWKFAIVHGLNPFVSRYIWYPDGFNLTWTTSVPTAALLGLPISLVGGAVLSYNVLSLAAPALAAWTAFLLARHITHDRAAAFIGGYLFGFSTYELGQMLGHLNLDMSFLVPIAVLLCVHRAQAIMGRRRFVVALSIVLLAELGLSVEILATLCVLGALTLAVFIACAPNRERRNLWRLAGEIMLAAALTAALAAPFLFYMAKGAHRVIPIPKSAVLAFSADPLNYLLPTQITEFGWRWVAPVAHRFPGNIAEQGAYLGLPLIMMIALYGREIRKSPCRRALLIVAILLILLSLGPWLQVAGFRTDLPLPWLLAIRLPLIHYALPTRFTLYVSLATAMIAALWLTKPGAWRRPRFALALLACLSLAPNLTAYGWNAWTAWTPWPRATFFTPHHIVHTLGRRPNVLILPFGSAGPSLEWQIDARFGFTMAGGYVNIMPTSEAVSGVLLNDLDKGTAGADFGAQLAAFCIENHVEYVLLGAGVSPAQRAAISALGWPQRLDRGISVVSASKAWGSPSGTFGSSALDPVKGGAFRPASP